MQRVNESTAGTDRFAPSHGGRYLQRMQLAPPPGIAAAAPYPVTQAPVKRKLVDGPITRTSATPTCKLRARRPTDWNVPCTSTNGLEPGEGDAPTIQRYAKQDRGKGERTAAGGSRLSTAIKCNCPLQPWRM
jgi:hypothetical protein